MSFKDRGGTDLRQFLFEHDAIAGPGDYLRPTFILILNTAVPFR